MDPPYPGDFLLRNKREENGWRGGAQRAEETIILMFSTRSLSRIETDKTILPHLPLFGSMNGMKRAPASVISKAPTGRALKPAPQPLPPRSEPGLLALAPSATRPKAVANTGYRDHSPSADVDRIAIHISHACPDLEMIAQRAQRLRNLRHRPMPPPLYRGEPAVPRQLTMGS